MEHAIQELNIQLPLKLPDSSMTRQPTLMDQILIIKDCIRSILYTITFHRALGEITPIANNCEIFENINYVG